MGPKKLCGLHVWEKLKNWQKMKDFMWFLLMFAWFKPFSQWKFSDKDLYPCENLQGIRKNGSQEAVATARVRKMDKTAKKERFSIIFANICMVQAISTKKFSDIDLHLGKNLQGIWKSGS